MVYKRTFKKPINIRRSNTRSLSILVFSIDLCMCLSLSLSFSCYVCYGLRLKYNSCSYYVCIVFGEAGEYGGRRQQYHLNRSERSFCHKCE